MHKMALPSRRFTLCLIVALGGVGSYGISLRAEAFSSAKDCKLQLVDEVTATNVGSAMSVNGMAQNISKIESKESREKVLKAYEVKWSETQGDPIRTSRLSYLQWDIVTKMIGTCLHTVQLDRKSYATSGYVSTLKIDTSADSTPINKGKSVPQPYGSEVLTDISHNDPGKKARTMMITNGFSVDANADFYLKNFGDDGWKLLHDHQIPIQKRINAARAITFAKKHEQHIIVITEGGRKSNVVVQWIEKP